MCVCISVCVSQALVIYGFWTGEHNWLEDGTLQGQGHTLHWPHRGRKLCHSHQLHQKFYTVVSWTCTLGHINN